MPSAWLLPSASLTPSALARAGTTSEASLTAASDTNAIPSRIVTRDDGTPRSPSWSFRSPGPVTVTTRCSSRPISVVRSSIPPEEWRFRIGKVARQAREVAHPCPGRRSAAGTQTHPAETAKISNGRPTFLSLNFQVHEREFRLVPNLIVNRNANADSPGDSEGLDAGCDVDRVPDETGGFDDHVADVDADPHGDVRWLAEFLLDRDRTENRIQGVREDGQGAIPVVLDDPPAERLMLRVQHARVLGACLQGEMLVFLHQGGEADHAPRTSPLPAVCRCSPIETDLSH